MDNMNKITHNIIQHQNDQKVQKMVETKVQSIRKLQDIAVETLKSLDSVENVDLKVVQKQSSICSQLISGLDDLPMLAFDLNNLPTIKNQKLESCEVKTSVFSEKEVRVNETREVCWKANAANPEEVNFRQFQKDFEPQEFLQAMNTSILDENEPQSTVMSYGTMFSTIMSEGVRNIPRDFATKELIKNNFMAVKKFQSIEIRPYQSETDSLIESFQEPVYQIDFDDYLSRLKIMADRVHYFWQSVKCH